MFGSCPPFLAPKQSLCVAVPEDPTSCAGIELYASATPQHIGPQTSIRILLEHAKGWLSSAPIMRDFLLPLQPEDLLRGDIPEHYHVEKENAPPVADLSEREQVALLVELEKKLTSCPVLICKQVNFDGLYCCISNYAALSVAARERLSELLAERAMSLLSFATSQERRNRSQEGVLHRNSLKMYSFLLCWLISVAQKANGQAANRTIKGSRARKPTQKDDQDSWNTVTKEKVINGLLHILEGDTASIWGTIEPDESWFQLFTKAAGVILEDPYSTKIVTLCTNTWRILGLLVSRYGYVSGVASLILRLAVKLEHFVPHAVELISALVADYQQPSVISFLFKEVIEMSNGSDLNHHAEGARNIARLLCGIAETQAVHTQNNIQFLLPLLEAEPYPLRNGIVLVIGRVLHLGFRGHHVGPVIVEGESDNGNEEPVTSDEEQEASPLSKQALWKIMEQRFHDVSSYTRSKLIQSWIYLCENKAIPAELQARLVGHAAERLKDKAVQVRKNSVKLLTSLLQHNPFSPTLQLAALTTKLPQEKRCKYSKLIGSINESTPEEFFEETEEFGTSDKTPLEQAVDFAIGFKKCMPFIGQLLLSPNSSEVVEALRFFVCAQQFALEDAQVGVRKMIHLVWSKEPTIKQALWQAFQELYLTTPPLEKQKLNSIDDVSLFVACKLISLTLSATIAELTSLEQLLMEMQHQGLISETVILTLLDIFALQVPKASFAESRGAVMILGMLSSASPDIVSKHFDLFIRTGLSSRAKGDFLLAQHTCIALQKAISRSDKKAQTTDMQSTTAATAAPSNRKPRHEVRKKHSDIKDKDLPPLEKLPSGHFLFSKLYELLTESPKDIGRWFGLAEQAINTIYALALAPDSICAAIINRLSILVTETESETAKSGMVQCEAEVLARLLFVVGHVALKQLIYLEHAQADIQRRRQRETASFARKQQKDHENFEFELGVAIAGDEEREVEYLQNVIENETVTKNLLGAFVPLIRELCSRSTSRGLVRECAILALCKYMCVSSSFCEAHLQLLFSLLASPKESAQADHLRANVIIAVGDLAFRFPNLLEPWTKHIYRPLSDPSIQVKRNAVMVLTHLILNDMIKVKAYIADLALCVHDEDPSISRMSRLFFHELAQKGATIYNIIPDVLSRLSADNTVSSELLRTVMKHLLSLIEKEKQTESLMEKFCHRLRTAKEGEQEDISFSLTLLNYNEKTLRRLIELEKCYATALVQPSVLNHFHAIIHKSRKIGAKAELRAAADDFEKMLTQLAAKSARQDTGESLSSKKRTQTIKSRAKAQALTRGNKQRSIRSSAAKRVEKANPVPSKKNKRIQDNHRDDDDHDHDDNDDDDDDDDDHDHDYGDGDEDNTDEGNGDD